MMSQVSTCCLQSVREGLGRRASPRVNGLNAVSGEKAWKSHAFNSEEAQQCVRSCCFLLEGGSCVALEGQSEA